MSNAHGSKWIRPERRLAIYARDGFSCAYCGAEDALSLDHVMPRELGGGHENENLVTCCVSCNSARRDSSMREWFVMLRDRGIITDGLAVKIRRTVGRKVDIALGKRLLAARQGI